MASNPTVTIWMIGGLGNQMFQYAAGKSLATKLNVPLRICTFDYRRPGRPYLLSKLSIPEIAADFDPLFKRAPPKLAKNRGGTRLLNFGARAGLWPTLYRESHPNFDPEFFNLRAPVELRGYFMSERYFIAQRDLIQGSFQPSEPLSSPAQEMLATIRQSEMSVAVHVRRGDFLKPGVPPMLDRDYYDRAVQCIEATAGRRVAHFLFTDDVEHAGRMFRAATASAVYAPPVDRPWEDIYLMARCSHNIIANSSFSWWGAWLNANPEKLVVAPKNMLIGSSAPAHTPDLFPANWSAI